MFLAETVPKLRFLWSFHLLVIMQPDMWVQHERSGGPELGVKSFQLYSLLIVLGGYPCVATGNIFFLCASIFIS
jgi:hypothetical protein